MPPTTLRILELSVMAKMGPQEHIKRRILHSDSAAQDKRDS